MIFILHRKQRIMMNLHEKLLSTPIQLTKSPETGHDLRKKWEQHFVNHLHENIKKSLHLYDKKKQVGVGYLWHVFSKGKKECLERKFAEDAFNQEPKKECYVFFEHGDDAFLIEQAHHLTASDLYSATDLYLVDIDFNWTYVITDEFKIGPYFSRKKGNSP